MAHLLLGKIRILSVNSKGRLHHSHAWPYVTYIGQGEDRVPVPESCPVLLVQEGPQNSWLQASMLQPLNPVAVRMRGVAGGSVTCPEDMLSIVREQGVLTQIPINFMVI